MLIFIDESGDTGLKLEKASSRYFVVSLIIFEDDEDALACDHRIKLLKKELGKEDNFEFHFTKNPDWMRQAFLKAVNPYNFFYLAIVINKDPKKLIGEGFRFKSSFYKYACGLVFQNAKPYLKNAKVKIDKSGSQAFCGALSRYLKNKVNNEKNNCIKHVKPEKSHTNNLLQLADYISGVINRKVQGKKDAKDYYKHISLKEINLQIWPK